MQPAPREVDFYPNAQADKTSTYLVSALTLRDIEQLNGYVRAKTIRAAVLSLEGVTNPSDRAAVLDSANRVAAEISLLSGAHSVHFNTVESVSYMLWIALAKTLSPFSHQDAYEIADDNRNSEEVLYALHIMRGLEIAAGAKPDTANPTPAQPAEQPQQ